MKKCAILFLILVVLLVVASLIENGPKTTEPQSMTVALME